MEKVEKWRRDADRKLSAPIERKRDINSIIGRVEDRFDAILDARRRGMPWIQIAHALEHGDNIKADAVESAFKRLCNERDIPVPRTRAPARPPAPTKPKTRADACMTNQSDQTTLFGRSHERWVDDGD